MSFFNELKRRNVFKVTIAYAVMAWLVMQIADVILNNVEAPGWVFHVILLLLGIGLLFAIFFAWAYELTPEGIKKEKDIDRTQSITHVTGRKLDFIIIGVMAVALGYFAYDKLVLSASREAAMTEAITQAVGEQAMAEQEAAIETDKSIAVLPFVNMSDDDANEYFSDGISEELINLLTKIPELRVIARTSAFSYRGKDTRLSQVAEELNVNHILEGSVRKSGDRIRITAQLIEAATEAHLWSETYDRTLADIFTIQDEIAAQVVEQLKITLLGAAPTVREVDPEAYALWMQGNYLLRDYREDSWKQAFDLFEQALAIEPDYANARFGLITKQYVDVFEGRVPYEEGSEKIRRALNEVLELDPVGGSSILAMLGVQAQSDYDLVAAAAYLRRAMELEPNSWTVLQRVAELLVALDRMDEAFMVYKHITVLDPLNHEAYVDFGWVQLIQGHMQEALDSFHTARLIKPEFPLLDLSVGNVYLLQGEAQAALEMFSKVPEDDYLWHGEKLGWTAMALYTLGRQNEYQATLSELIERFGNQQPFIVALVYAWAGDADTCFTWLDKAVDQHNWGLYTRRLSPEFDSIRDDPRWTLFNERIGLSPEKIAAIEFNISLPK